MDFQVGDVVLTMSIRSGVNYDEPTECFVAKVIKENLLVRYFHGPCTDDAVIHSSECELIKRPKEKYVPEKTFF